MSKWVRESNDRWKLLRDLPGVNAGRILVEMRGLIVFDGNSFDFEGDPPFSEWQYRFKREIVESSPDWFEKTD